MPRTALLALTALPFVLLQNAAAQDAASTTAVYACAELDDDLARLACYDDAVGRLQAAEQAGEVTTISKAEVAELERESFGFSLPSIPKLVMPKFGGGEVKEIDSLDLAIASVSGSRDGGLQVTLENGQVWRQTDSKPIRISRKNAPERATIKRAAFGSFMMKLDNSSLFRVERVK